IYFGQNSPSYSIVHTKQAEFDYPNSSEAGQQNFTYDGRGGVPIGSLFHRLLSGAITKSSRILYDRDPRARVQKVAPWLTLDGNPYPAVVGNRIVWVV